VAAGILLRENLRLRGQMNQAQIERSQLESRIQQLEQRAQAPSNVAAAQPERPSSSQDAHAAAAPKIFAFSLKPQLRGAGQVTSIQLPPETALVAPELNLESDDFPAYRVALKNLTSGEVIWRSDILKPRAKGAFRAVAIRFPASVLKPETYSFDLSGLPPKGAPEFVGSYLFRVSR
jgi:TolA-binding protein